MAASVARGPSLSAFCGRLWHLPGGAGTTRGRGELIKCTMFAMIAAGTIQKYW